MGKDDGEGDEQEQTVVVQEQNATMKLGMLTLKLIKNLLKKYTERTF